MNTPPPIRSAYLGPQGSPYEGGRLLENLLLFGRVCRALGMTVTPNVMLDVARALELVNMGKKWDVYHTMRALIVTRRRDLELFDEAFRIFWQRPANEMTTLDLSSLGERRRQKKTQFLPPPAATPDDPTSDEPKPAIDPSLLAIVPTHSQSEVLRHKDFANMTGAELQAAKDLMEELPWSLGSRVSRRYRASGGTQIDLRRIFRSNVQFADEFLTIPTRSRKTKPRPLVLLCDISGSMERYTRLLLHFTHTLANTMYQVESFVFSTHLTRITQHIRRKSVDVALRDVGTSVSDWGGGTRTGEALHQFNYFWSRRVLGQGAMVLLITDGWDRGDPDQLRTETRRLQLSCYRLMWLNPLLGSPEYEPLTRGAQALLPYVDDFLPVFNIASLESLAHELLRVNWRRPSRSPHAHLIRQ
ncbi:MAG: VWA domain-containing protein [Chloroflexaceae bacterium]|nr:VWA domain-containing protein [Chloroflexaceae bacterium]